MKSKKTNHLNAGGNTLPEKSSCAPFPTHVLPPSLEAMVRAVADVIQVPEVLPAALALAMVSAALGKGLRIASGLGRRTMGNLFLLVSAYSGAGKSSVLRIMREPIQIIEDYLRTFSANQANDTPKSRAPAEGDGGSEGFVGLFPPPGREKSDCSRSRRNSKAEQSLVHLTCSDATGQALAKLLAENKETILSATAEVGKLLKEASMTTSKLGELLLKGYSGDSVEIHRVTRKPVVLYEPCITLCWLCQPHRLEAFLGSDQLLEDGLLARFCVAHSGAGMTYMKDDDSAIPVPVIDSYGAVINSLYEFYGQQPENGLIAETTPEAREILRTYYNRCVDRCRADQGKFGSCIARWAEQA